MSLPKLGLTKDQLERLTNRSPDIVIATDHKGRVIYFNDGAHDTLGYESEEVLGGIRRHVLPDDRRGAPDRERDAEPRVRR